MRHVLRHLFRAARNAFVSEGFRLFGLTFARDYLWFALRAVRRWGATDAGTLEMLGFRIDYFNQSHALFLVHEVFVNGTYAFRTREARPRVIDGGANIGLTSLFFKALYPSAQLTAIEPEPLAFARLSDTIARNGLRDVRLINAALAERDGATTLYRNPLDAGSITASVNQTRGGGLARDVAAIRLSSLIDEPVDFLKLDVEGAEYGVLRDLVATGTILRVRQAVIEYHDIDSEPGGVDGLIRALESSGMRIERLADDRRSGVGLLRAHRC